MVVVFAVLATADTFVCPDGCESASSTSVSATDGCSASGTCVFCTGGLVVIAADPLVAPLIAAVVVPAPPASDHPLCPAAALDRPPRLA